MRKYSKINQLKIYDELFEFEEELFRYPFRFYYCCSSFQFARVF